MDSRSIQALASLLTHGEKESDTELDGSSPYATPGSIGPSGNVTKTDDSKKECSSKHIWTSDEVQEEGRNYDYNDPRPQPEYDMLFKQSVGTEDVFLGMGHKNPTTACCENIVVRIKLPGTDIKDVELDVMDTFIDCRTPKCRLGLYIPNKVDSRQSKAKWISDNEELHITLVLQREYDFINQ